MKCEYTEDSLKSFVDSWRTEELTQKIASLRNLSSFSKHLEHSCIQKDILPPLKGIFIFTFPIYTTDTLEKEDDDEVLLVIAEELGKFSEFGASLLVLPVLIFPFLHHL
jgi:hypothetical protein